MNTGIVDGHILAEFWEVSIRTIQNYSNEKKFNPPLPKVDTNKYDLITACKWIYNMQKEKIHKLKTAGDEKLSDLKKEKQIIDNKKAELALKREMRKIVDAKSVLIAWTNLQKVIKNNDTQLEYDLIRDLEGVTDEKKKAEIISKGFAEKDRQLERNDIVKYIVDEESFLREAI